MADERDKVKAKEISKMFVEIAKGCRKFVEAIDKFREVLEEQIRKEGEGDEDEWEF